jgi:hypothetical protein
MTILRKRISAAVLIAGLLLPAATLAQAVRITPAERRMAEKITAKQLGEYLHFVASDVMEGRDTPSRGLDTTAEFLKMMLAKWGFKPAGDNGTFFQNITLKRNAVDRDNAYLEIGGKRFKWGEGFYRLAASTGEVRNASVIFAGDGWVIPSKGLDPFRGVDVRGKIVPLSGSAGASPTAVIGLPAGVTQTDLGGPRGTDWEDGLGYAARNGAAGVIILPSAAGTAVWERESRRSGTSGMWVEGLHDRPPRSGASRGLSIPVYVISETAAAALFDGPLPADSGAAGAREIAAKTVSSNIPTVPESHRTQNVVAVWEGADPVLKKEMVAVGAHYDHVGINDDFPGPDKIFNGADDDGSGTVALLAMAEALATARARPKRSILFVWHSAEEKGLWGSEYFNKFPTVDIKNVIAQLNIDMIGRSKAPGDTAARNRDLTDANSIYVIGAEMMSSTLGTITAKTNDAYLKIRYDRKYDDPKDTNRFFFRSDHFHYAKNGIPIVFWFDGVHVDYHRPGDHADKIDYAKLERVTRTIFMTALKLADLRTRPAVDKQLPAELQQR